MRTEVPRAHTDNLKTNAFVYLFMVQTLVWGLVFTVFVQRPAVQNTLLYQSMRDVLHHQGVVVWGAIALVIVILMLLAAIYNNYQAGKLGCLAGYLIWIFAGCMYLTTASWLSLLTTFLPNIVFWTWFYFTLWSAEHSV